MTRTDLAIFLAFAVSFMIIAVAVNTPEIASGNRHFAAEYGNIAAALVAGAGYSDPFETGSGPTAWMPPLYTLLLAAVFALFGVKTTAAAWCLILLKSLGLSVIPVLLHRLVSRRVPPRLALWILPIYLLFLLESFRISFLQMHDIWLQMLFVTLIVYTYFVGFSVRGKAFVEWGLVGGLAILTNPVLGLLFAALTLFPFERRRASERAAAVAIALAICLPWTIRNYLVFERLVPVKSVLFIQLYQANVVDEDGILGDETFLAHHPFANAEARQEYALLGESRYLAKYRAEFLRELARRPAAYLERVARRSVAAYLVPLPTSRPSYDGSILGATEIAVHLVPAMCVLTVFLLRRARADPVFAAATACFVLYLLPYVVVGFYYRYWWPLIPVFTLLVFFAAETALAAWPRGRSGPSPHLPD